MTVTRPTGTLIVVTCMNQSDIIFVQKWSGSEVGVGALLRLLHLTPPTPACSVCSMPVYEHIMQ